MTQNVILAPGLWMPGAAMLLLAARLERRGHRVEVFDYRGRSPFESNIEDLARFVRRSINGHPFALVGHSLGGVLILDMLNRHAELEPSAVVLLGAPVRGCLAGRRLGTARLGRWMMGACRQAWEERPARWARGAPLGVVAGTRPIGLGRAF